MITYSGIHVTAESGSPTADDIAVASGRICRFAGALWEPLLAHSVLVGHMLMRRDANDATIFWGFLHDAHETVTSDVPPPFKCQMMKEAQERIDADLKIKFLGPLAGEVDLAAVHEVDVQACDLEARLLHYDLKYFELRRGGGHGPLWDGCCWDDRVDIGLTERVFASKFFLKTTKGLDSHGVRSFRYMLELLEQGRRVDAMREVLSWKLL